MLDAVRIASSRLASAALPPPRKTHSSVTVTAAATARPTDHTTIVVLYKALDR